MKMRSRWDSSIRNISGVVYKGKGHKYSEFVARFLGRAREESRGLVVFDNRVYIIEEANE